MSNHWVDIGNASLIFVIGANPSENHPASMAHVNRARYDLWNRGRKARMVVVDPRKTRTAVQADVYVRIRPGTDIAFINGLLNYVFTGVEGGTLNPTFSANFVGWHNGTEVNSPLGAVPNSTSLGRIFYDDSSGSAGRTMDATRLHGGLIPKVLYNGVATNAFDSPTYGLRGWPKWCDTRVKVDSSDPNKMDYKRVTMTDTQNSVYSNMIELAESIGDPDCVYQKLKAHCAAYTDTVVADICGCAPSDIAVVAEELIANSQMMSNDFSANGYHQPNSAGYRATTLMYAMGTTQHTYGSQNVRSYAVLQTMLGNMGRPGGGINALRGIHNVQGSTDMGVLFDGIPGYYTGNPGHVTLGESYAAYNNRQFGYRLVNGTSPVTSGAKSAYVASGLGLQQQGFYNMTSAFFGDWRNQWAVNADFDKLFDLWPKGNGKDHITAFRLMDTGDIRACVVWGQNPGVTEPNQNAVRAGLENLDLLVVVDNFETETAAVRRKPGSATYLLPASSYVEEAGSVSNSGRWIQWRMRARKPHGNSKADIDLLLRFAKELDRAGGFTHITNQWATLACQTDPSAAAALTVNTTAANSDVTYTAVTAGLAGNTITVEYAASATATAPLSVAVTGNDIKVTLATTTGVITSTANDVKTAVDATPAAAALVTTAVEGTGAGLVNIMAKAPLIGGSEPIANATNAYTVLFGTQYGYDPGALNVAGDIEAVTRVSADGVAAVGAAGTFGFVAPGGLVYGTEAVCENIFEQLCNTLGASGAGGTGKGTLWIYARAYNESKSSERPSFVNGTGVPWTKKNRAKERNITDVGSWYNYPRFGFAWLLNRRVMYNNVAASSALTTLVPDESDNFVGPGYLARMMTFTARQTNTMADWTGHFSYRSYNTMRDMPSTVVDATENIVLTGTKHAGGLPGNIPAHCEPIETPRRDLAATWGRNMQWKPASVSEYGPTVKTDTPVAMWSTTESFTDANYGSGGSWTTDAKDYPLVLTTIRCVEHFQGGPITRNNSWNVEAEPVPWIEINSVDARACVPPIKDGDWVNVITARSNSTTNQHAITPLIGAAPGTNKTGWAKGFKARVGVGLQGNQRVGVGVVAIPWHWGDQGLGKGSRANDLCIDAFDSNTVIPEYKACLCKIEKIV
jgi:anaerobic selenocysteine-containing dehydrogenase